MLSWCLIKQNIKEVLRIVRLQPVIKWTGSKRSQAEHIINKFPKEIDTYYEPFVGGLQCYLDYYIATLK